MEINPVCRNFCKEFTDELLRSESVIDTLREIDNKVRKNSHNCFINLADALYSCFKIVFPGLQRQEEQEEFKENLEKVIEIYEKINAEIGKVQKPDKTLKYLEDAKRRIEFFMATVVEKLDEKWRDIPSKMKEKVLQMLVSGNYLYEILGLISLSSEYSEILRKYENEIRNKIREDIEKKEYYYLGKSIPIWIKLYEKLGLDLRELSEEVERRISTDIGKYEEWRLEEPRHPYEEVVEKAKERFSDEFTEFMDRKLRLNTKYNYAMELIKELFLRGLNDFPKDRKMEIFEYMVKLLAENGDIYLLTTLQKELSEVEDSKKYNSILQKYLPLAAERFANLLEIGYDILDEAQIFLSLMDNLPENLRERGLRVYLKRERVGSYLLDLAQNPKIPIDIRVEAVKKAVDYYIKTENFEKIVDIYFGEYNTPEEAKEYVEKEIRRISEVVVAYLSGLGKYKKVKALIDNNLIKREVMEIVNKNRKRLAEWCMDRLLYRFFDGEISSSTYEENLKAIIEDSQLPPETRERAKYLLRYLERK